MNMIHTMQDPDYKNLFFEHPELTMIHGEPTTAGLLTLRNEVKANAMTVHTTLGGGANGHLGLVMDVLAYALIPGTRPYVRPVHPGALTIPNNATQYQIAQQRDAHAEATRLFREANAVERVLVQQIVAAIEPQFLKAIRNSVTSRITRTIPEIFDYLFKTYGNVTRTELSELKQRVENMQFIASEPVDVIITEIDDLADIAEIAKSPLTDSQKIDLAYPAAHNQVFIYPWQVKSETSGPADLGKF